MITAEQMKSLRKEEYQCFCHCGLRSEIFPNKSIDWWRDQHNRETNHKSVLIRLTTEPTVITEDWK